MIYVDINFIFMSQISNELRSTWTYFFPNNARKFRRGSCAVVLQDLDCRDSSPAVQPPVPYRFPTIILNCMIHFHYRKRSMLINTLFGILAGGLMGLSVVADSYEMIIIGRLIVGFHCGNHCFYVM